MSAVIGNPLLLSDEGYQISRSVRLRSSASGYFSRTLGTPTDNKKFVWSGWVKRGFFAAADQVLYSSGASTGTSDFFELYFASDSTLRLYGTAASNLITNVQTAAVYRDPSAFYHVVLVIDTTLATAADRIILYVNGQRQGLTINTQIAQNAVIPANVGGYLAGIGSIRYNSSWINYFDGLITEINFIDGQALTPSSFGETDAITGVWKPKKYTGTYGTNGFYLNFSDNSSNTATTIGKDYSGNGNNWTPNNISVTSGSTYDSMLDVPTMWADGGSGRGNYCVLNPLNKGSSITIADGNLNGAVAGATWSTAKASIGVSSGKWYFEVVMTSGSNAMVGITSSTDVLNGYLGTLAGEYVYQNNGNKWNNNSSTSYGASWTTNDVIGTALDLDTGTITFYKNNSSQGTAFTGIPSNTYFPAISDNASTTVINFGQRPFTYTPPSGFKALNTQNLPEPTIKKGNQYFDAITYTGDGASSRTIGGLAFQPDLVWNKQRSGTFNHILVDAVRGGSPGLAVLQSNLTDAEYTTLGGGGGISAIASNGFVLSAGSSSNNNLNGSGSTYVAWQWKEGATPGFDIVTYTGTGANRTVAHSLGVAPAMMIVKSRSYAGSDWDVYHSATGATKRLFLNTTAAAQTTSVAWNDTAPTSSVFTVGTGSDVNANTQTYVAYLFAEVAGFSKFGSYTGNGSSDGPFVFCGFRPKFVLTKRTDSSISGNWMITDSARNTYNLAGEILIPNLSDLEYSQDGIDILSNGFKMRASTGNRNTSGGTFIFAAFAENPFKYSLAR